MLHGEALLALATFTLVASITPGPNNLMLMSSGANFGFGRSVPHVLGVSIGVVLMIGVVGTGLHQAFDAFPWTYTALQIICTGYLIYLAFKIATAAPTASGVIANKPAKPFTFLQAALFQWVNPKAWAIALTACASYVPVQHPLLGLVLVAGIFGLIGLLSASMWTLMGGQMRQVLSNPRRLRAFNILAATLLLLTLYPVIAFIGTK